MAKFQAVGYPARSEESWRFTNLDPIIKTSFAPAKPADRAAALEINGQSSFGRAAAAELVFINGQYVSRISHTNKIPNGVKVTTLAGQEAVARDHLAKLASVESNPFVALNTASFGDAAMIHLPRNSTVDGPIHLLFVSIAGDVPTVSHPRVLIVAEENAQAMIVESYVGTGSIPYFTNAVTEVIAAASARLDHCKLQQESSLAYHIATTQVRLAGEARFVSHSATMGAALTRNDVNVVLAGERADATLNGLVLLDGTRHCDNHTLLDHAAAHCPSHELYKHVLGGKSTGVFKGQIVVRPDSQKTDSKQTSKTLLLSDDAQMNSMPALEIYADDVKCTHGSTTGPVDEEQVFYLRSRGVSHEAARHLLTYAFAADITRRIRVEPVRARIENYMAAQHGLPQDLRITDLGGADEAVVNI